MGDKIEVENINTPGKVTRVDAALLAGSRVRFVGSATIGTDHVDLTY